MSHCVLIRKLVLLQWIFIQDRESPERESGRVQQRSKEETKEQKPASSWGKAELQMHGGDSAALLTCMVAGCGLRFVQQQNREMFIITNLWRHLKPHREAQLDSLTLLPDQTWNDTRDVFSAQNHKLDDRKATLCKDLRCMVQDAHAALTDDRGRNAEQAFSQALALLETCAPRVMMLLSTEQQFFHVSCSQSFGGKRCSYFLRILVSATWMFCCCITDVRQPWQRLAGLR